MARPLSASPVIHAASLIRQNRRAVALTGAGISTPSGVPDFRSPGSGLWEHVDPMEVASLTAFRHNPARFYEWVRPLALHILQAQPNPAHLSLARLERAGRLMGVVTQNIDDLHRKAGSVNVLELHGHLRQVTCVSCYHVFPTQAMVGEWFERGTIPRCPDCGGVLKPNAVLFEEQLPYEILRQAQRWMRMADLVLVIGSSLEVMPAARLPVEAANAGARLIIINREPTYLDERADAILRQDVAEVLPALVDEVLGEA